MAFELQTILRQLHGRNLIFLIILSFPALAWVFLVLLFYYADIAYSSRLVAIVAAISPVIAQDVSLFGEITPAALAGCIIALSPTASKISSWSQLPNLIALALAATIYAMYLHLMLFFSLGGDGIAIFSYNWVDYANQQKSILGIVSAVKTSAAVIFASIIGLRLKDAEKKR